MDFSRINEIFRKDLLEGCAPFWMKYAWDRECGGILPCIDENGAVFSYDKGVWMQGRAGWMYAWLYNNFRKNPEYLVFAKDCIDFAREKCTDADGRMYTTVTREGGPLIQNRQWFSETFYIMANAEYFIATGERFYLDEARRCYDMVLRIYRHPETDPCKIGTEGPACPRAAKSFAQPMILLNVTGIMRKADMENEAFYNARADELVSDIKCFHTDEYAATLETVSLDNRVIIESAPCRVMNPGHVIECSWFMLEEGIYRQNEETCAWAEKIFNEALEWGWDKEYGGILYNRDILNMPVEAYEQDLKVWWVHNEAIIASFMFHRHTRNERYRQLFETLVDYAWKHLRHAPTGEWFGAVNRDGSLPYHPFMGHTYKGPFHVMRMLGLVGGTDSQLLPRNT